MRRALGVAVLLVFCMAGCNSAPKPKPGTPTPGKVDLSRYTYEQVATAMNQRADRLERFYAATLTTVWYIGKEGRDEVDQLDGDLHIVQPDHIALSMRKVGVSVAALGANTRYYWYMDLLADDPVAMIGTHAKADPDQLAGLGVPVHPLDLLLLLGFSRVPEEPMDPEQPLKLSPGGDHVVVSAPARWGVVEYTLNPDTLEPVRVVIRRDMKRPPVLTADMLDGTVPFDDRINRELPEMSIPKRVLIDVPGLEARVQIRFTVAESHKRRPDERAFDLGESMARYGVEVSRDMDVMHARPVGRR